MNSNNKRLLIIKILVAVGSVGMLAFGVWHFFVPRLWDWYAYIDPQATELVIAVRAINVFFSLCLVLFGIANLLLVYFKTDRFSKIVLLATTTALWVIRVALQLVYPQGSASPALQYGMVLRS